MTFPRKLLAPNEEIVLESHPNWSILVPRVTVFLLVAAGCIALLIVLPHKTPVWVGWILLAASLLALGWLLMKIATWRATSLVLTNQRVVYRTGVLRRLGREIPLDRVQDVTYVQSLFERMLGAGSLTIESAGQGGEEPFPDIRHPALVQSLINRLITQSSASYGGRAGGLGGGYGGSPQQYQPPAQPPQQYQAPQQYQPAQQYPPQAPPPQYQPPQYQPPQYQPPQYQPGQQYQQPTQPQYQAPPEPSQYAPPEQYPQQPPDQSQPEPQSPPQPLHRPAPAADSPQPPPRSSRSSQLPGSSSEQLNHLAHLRDIGVITEAEYEEKRQEVIDGS
jgi:membrane protein YdbS with pleckstrin-like domain